MLQYVHGSHKLGPIWLSAVDGIAFAVRVLQRSSMTVARLYIVKENTNCSTCEYGYGLAAIQPIASATINAAVAKAITLPLPTIVTQTATARHPTKAFTTQARDKDLTLDESAHAFIKQNLKRIETRSVVLISVLVLVFTFAGL